MADIKKDPSDDFERLIEEKRLEGLMPQLKGVHEHMRNLTEGGLLKLDTLKPGDEITMEFYPAEEDLDPEKMRVLVREVKDSYIQGLASGGSLNWEDEEVTLGGCVFAPGGSMKKVGTLEPGLYPEFNYYDEEKYQKAAKKIRDIIFNTEV